MIQLRHFSIEAIQCNAERLKCLETAFDVYKFELKANLAISLIYQACEMVSLC